MGEEGLGMRLKTLIRFVSSQGKNSKVAPYKMLWADQVSIVTEPWRLRNFTKVA